MCAVGWQTCSRRASGTWCPPPETLGEGRQYHTGRLDLLSLAAGAGGPGRGTTLPPQLAPARSLEDLYWAQGLGSDWPSQPLHGTTAAPSGKCSHESPDSLWPGPLGYLVNLRESTEKRLQLTNKCINMAGILDHLKWQNFHIFHHFNVNNASQNNTHELWRPQLRG